MCRTRPGISFFPSSPPLPLLDVEREAARNGLGIHGDDPHLFFSPPPLSPSFSFPLSPRRNKVIGGGVKKVGLEWEQNPSLSPLFLSSFFSLLRNGLKGKSSYFRVRGVAVTLKSLFPSPPLFFSFFPLCSFGGGGVGLGRG